MARGQNPSNAEPPYRATRDGVGCTLRGAVGGMLVRHDYSERIRGCVNNVGAVPHIDNRSSHLHGSY